MSEPTANQVLVSARMMFQPADVIEMRVPKAGRQRTVSGYFDDLEKLSLAAAQLEGVKYPGIYWTLNPVNRALLSRAENKIKPFAEATTGDADILCRRWLPVDFDPRRPSGISATEGEHAAALQLAEQVRGALLDDGWTEPVFADSGNGAHLLYPIELPNDAEATELLRRCLEALAGRFDTPAISIDRTTFNASRIFKTYGTTARKGDNTADRPHRLSRILQLPALVSPISTELLNRLASSAAPKPRPPVARPSRAPGPRRFDVGEFLARYGLRHRPVVGFEGGYKYVLEQCPFDPTHKAPDAAVFEGADGRLGFKCFHNSCQGREWRHLRELLEPGYSTRSAGFEAPPLPPESQAPPVRDGRDEIPLGAADVEAAIDAFIEQADLAAAMRLIPEIAKVPLHIQALIQSKLRKKFKRDFPANEFKRSVKELAEKQAEPPPPPDDDEELPKDAPDLTGFPLTDSGNAERIIAVYGRDLRFCSEFQKWLIWDGRRHRVDQIGAVTQLAKNVARLLHKQAADKPDAGLRKILRAHARDSESQAAIANALKRAATEQGIPVMAADLDLHRYLLNCTNGVVDVRTGELLEHERRYLITKLCHVKYMPDAYSERFDKFVRWTMGESPDDGEERASVARMVDFIQKAFGYALTGDVSEKAAFICFGKTGNNGKTTLLTIMTTLLAEYSTQLDINTLMTTKLTDNNIRADMAKLHGARLVITSEVDDGQKLSERLMKYLTAGMGKIVACRKFENPIEFDATHKIFMDCNYQPNIRGGDKAIWARLKCVPFLQHLPDEDINGQPNPEMDKKLKDKILGQSEGVLAWIVRGAVRWAKEGLGAPPEVKAANIAWQEKDDPLKEFLEECCEFGDPEDGFWVKGSELTAVYVHWCKENNEKFTLSRAQLHERLELKGFPESRSRRDLLGKQMRTREGLRLRPGVVTVPGM